MSEYQLNEPPTDGISAVKFGPKSSQYLLASSWDCHVRLYDIESNELKASYKHPKAVLDCCFGPDTTRAFSGGLNGQLKAFDFHSQREIVLGGHRDAIRAVHYCSTLGLVITGSWDGFIKLWDVRAANCVGSYEQPDKVYTLDTCEDKLVVGTANRKIRIWTLTNMGMPESRESSLRFQTRSIRCFPNRQGFVLSSIEGRVAVEYFDMSAEAQRKKYAFKCHRSKDADTSFESVYPVNAIAFHELYNTFATGGSDCMVNIWDPFNKKRLCQFHSYPTSITSLSFDQAGNTLAIASSYHFERGDLPKETYRDSIYIRKVSELETKPK